MQVLISPEEADLVFNKFLSTLNKDLELSDDFEVSMSGNLNLIGLSDGNT